LVVLLLALGIGVLGRQILVPSQATLSGNVVIAEWFYTKGDQGTLIPREFQTWPDEVAVMSADDYDIRIEAHPGDVLVLSPGQYKADLFVFTPNLRITTDPKSTSAASIWGTVEIDADGVVLDHLAVVGPRKGYSSGHGIEVNRVFVRTITIENCHVEGKEWTGIHIIGPTGDMREMRVENCELIHNGLDGMDAQQVARLVITGCTITDNGWNYDHGVGVRIGYGVTTVEMTGNVIERNRYANVSQRE